MVRANITSGNLKLLCKIGAESDVHDPGTELTQL